MTNSAALNRTLFLEDNLPVLRGLDSDSIDLIATDPPFNKGVGAFEGTTKARGDMGALLCWMGARMLEMRRVFASHARSHNGGHATREPPRRWRR